MYNKHMHRWVIEYTSMISLTLVLKKDALSMPCTTYFNPWKDKDIHTRYSSCHLLDPKQIIFLTKIVHLSMNRQYLEYICNIFIKKDRLV
jgi:hypothetical protein